MNGAASDWTIVRLGELISHRKEFIQIDDVQKYKRCRVQLHAKGIALRDEVEGITIKTKKQQVCHAGELLVAEIDAKVGGFGIVPPELDGAIVSSHYFIYTLNSKKVDSAFIDYFVRTPLFRDQVQAQGSTNYAAIKADQVLDYQIPLPRLSKQRRIVAKIERLAAKVDEANELRISVDALTYTFTMSLHKRLSRSRIVKIKDLLELSEDRHEISHDESYPQVGIRGFGGGLFAKPALRGAETKYRYFNRLRTDQIVLSQVKGWEGAIDVCPSNLEGYYASPEYRTFNCKPATCHPAYFSHFIKTPWFHSLLGDATRGQGARRERTRPELFLSLELPMPKLSDQKRATVLLQNLRIISVSHQQTATKLDALLPSILDKAFKGEL